MWDRLKLRNTLLFIRLSAFVVILVAFFNSCASHSEPHTPWLDPRLDAQAQSYLVSLDLRLSVDNVHWFYDSQSTPHWVRVDLDSPHLLVAGDQYVVKILEDSLIPDLQKLADEHQWQWMPFGSNGLGVIQFHEDELKDYQIIENRLKKSGLFSVVEVNPLGFGSEVKLLPKSPLSPSHQLWSMDRIEVPEVREWARKCNQIVWVLDTGTDLDHEDLENNLWVNGIESNGIPGVDDDHNGYVDDIHGYDFVNKEGDPTDDHGHGSHVAGVIGAREDNNLGISGICGNAKIASLKVMNSMNRYLYSDLIAGIDYLLVNQEISKIANMSLGGTSTTSLLRAAFQDLHDHGILVGVAAMNDGGDLNHSLDYYPVEYPLDNLIGVASIDSIGFLASNSNYGTSSVDLAAPGVSIYSLNHLGSYTLRSGTSMAVPHVVGVAALLSWGQPSWNYQDIRQRIMTSSSENSAINDKVGSGGELNAYCAVQGIIPCAGQGVSSLKREEEREMNVTQVGDHIRIKSPPHSQVKILNADGQVLKSFELRTTEGWIDLPYHESFLIIKIDSPLGPSLSYKFTNLR